jgi:ethanolamine utilization protein EutN
MKLGRVIGNIVSTIKNESLKGSKLLLVEGIDLSGRRSSSERRSSPPEVAIDRVDAGIGDIVLLIDEGNSVRQILGDEKVPARTLIVGFVDHYDVDKKYLQKIKKAPVQQPPAERLFQD